MLLRIFGLARQGPEPDALIRSQMIDDIPLEDGWDHANDAVFAGVILAYRIA